MAVTKGIFDNDLPAQQHNKRYIDDNVLVYMVKNGWKNIRKNYALITENKIVPSWTKLKKSGFRFSFPFLSHCTVINLKLFSREFNEKWDTKNLSDVNVKTNAVMQIIDPLKFYEKFCGHDKDGVIKKDDTNLNDLVYKEVGKMLRMLISQCEYETLKKIATLSIEDPVKRENGKYQELKFTEKTEDKILDLNVPYDTVEQILNGLNDIMNNYGIYIKSLGVIDSTLPDIVREQQEAEKAQRREAELKKHLAAVNNEIALQNARARRNIQQVMGEGDRDRLLTTAQAYRELGLTPEQIALLEAAKTGNNVTIFSGINQNQAAYYSGMQDLYNTGNSNQSLNNENGNQRTR